MGKVVDSVAASLSVQNHNNVGGPTKLKLLRGADGESVCEDMSAPLAALLDSEQLFNGDKVSLEYVENSSWFFMLNVNTKYKYTSSSCPAAGTCHAIWDA